MTPGGWPGHCHLTAVQARRRSSCDMQEVATTTYTFRLLPPLQSSPSDSSPVTELTRRRRRRRGMKGKKREEGRAQYMLLMGTEPHPPHLTLMDKLQSDTCILKHNCTSHSFDRNMCTKICWLLLKVERPRWQESTNQRPEDEADDQ